MTEQIQQQNVSQTPSVSSNNENSTKEVKSMNMIKQSSQA